MLDEHTPAINAEMRWFFELANNLLTYARQNRSAMIDYCRHYWTNRPISSSRAESTVNSLVNARMNKRRQMRWSPMGAHRVLQVRAAVFDGRVGEGALNLAA
jgi:hypothetical protein